MARLLDWLKIEIGGWKILLFILDCLILKLLYSACALKTISLLFNYPVSKKIPLDRDFPFLLIGVVVIEEVIFRLPLASLIEKRGASRSVLLVATALSGVYGLLHGGIPALFIQGVGGFIYSLIFLKCGGFQKKYLKAIVLTIAAHYAFDGIIAIIALASDVRAI